MHFLITNDDGFGAPGLQILAEAAGSFGEVSTVAPKTEQSGMSHRLSFDRTLTFEKKEKNGFVVDGTPGDCVRLAISKMEQKFDWVLSGINDGANLGVEIYYSGTVAAAREAAMLGIPSIALSQYRRKYASPFDWSNQLKTVKNLLEKLLSQPLASGCWLNVNFPDTEDSRNVQFVECAADMSPLPNTYTSNNNGFELDFRYSDRPRQQGLDVETCFNRDVSITRHKIGEQMI